MARERLVKAVNRLGVVRRNGRSRKVGLALVLTVLVGGRARVRNAAETFGLERELMGRWENSTTRGGTGGPVGAGEGSGGRHHRRHRGSQGVLQGEGREPPREVLDLLPRPPEVREGKAPHGRHSGPLHGQDVHGGGFPMGKRVSTELWIKLGHYLLHNTVGIPPTATSPSTTLILIF